MPDLKISDSKRDAQSYYRLLLALELAKEEIRTTERVGRMDIDEVLGRLLPVLAEALNAEQAFVAILRHDEAQAQAFQFTAAHPQEELCGQPFGWSDLLARLVADGEPLVIAPLEETKASLIPGLERLHATSAILVRMRVADEVRIVGICNKAHSQPGHFLAPDRMVLDSIVELLAIGARVGERHKRELESLQKISAAIGTKLGLGELLPTIVRQAAEVFDAPATSLMLWDESKENLVIQAQWGVSDEYARRQKISRQVVWKAVESAGRSQPFLVPDLQREPLGDLGMIEREALRTVLAAPLLVNDELIGCLNIYSKQEPRIFSADDRELARIFANQAAVAIHKASLYDTEIRQSQTLRALLEASKAISAGFTTSRKQVLDRISEQAVECLSRHEGIHLAGNHVLKAIWATIMLYDEARNELCFESLYPPTVISELDLDPAHKWSLDREQAPGGKIGISGRAVLQRKTQRVADVRDDPDYLDLDPVTLSELDVPLLDDGSVIGVLGVESDRPNAFDTQDERALEGLAELAVIAIKNAERAGQLSLTNAVAFMGAWGADVVHDVNREVGAIRRAVFMLPLQHKLDPGVVQRLQDIDQYAAQLALAELPVQIAGSGGSIAWDDAALLDPVLQAEAQSLDASHPAIDFLLDLDCPGARVAIREQWLRRLARHLIRNAIQAIPPENALRRITVRTRLQESMAEVQVEDTGKGVQPAIRSSLFQQSIPHSDGVSGQGLLLVRFLAEQHGGYVQLAWSEPGAGSCFVFGVPLARQEESPPLENCLRR